MSSMKPARLLESSLFAVLMVGTIAVGSYASGGFEPSVLSAGWIETAKLTAADGVQFDNFGYSVALSGDTALVGALWGDGGSGSAYAFERDPADSTVWTQTDQLTADDRAVGDHFGAAIALTGDTALVSAWLDDDLGTNSGSAYVFERDPLDPTLWTQTAKLMADDGAADDWFGRSVALSGDTALVGALFDDDLGANSGSAYIFERDPAESTVWTQAAKLTADDGAAEDWFGISVAISGDLAIVGSPSNLGSTGSAYVFERDPADPTVWTQVAKLTADDGAGGDEFGVSVVLEGGTALVGAWLNDDLGHNSGSAYVFERDPVDSTVWTQVAKLTADDGRPGDQFGYSLQLGGKVALVGALFDTDLDPKSGSAYVFERDPADPTVWTQAAKLTASDQATDDSFGWSVALAGGTALIGALNDDDLGTDSGSAYIFEGLPLLAVRGTCPGPADVEVIGATEAGTVGLVRGTETGSFVLGGACAGTELGLADPQLLRALTADGDGGLILSPDLPEGACRLYLQALDVTTCEPSNVVQVP